ncbi:MAG: hypothetical protein O9270_12845 [Aquidulcibacter sp.]|jgi:PBP1b-binding outer membrane lipoprotein LpoB|uniref:hypothetical protein n=1 Tax=Aquidulcibacter sp. TaxID=2052990 RepID=UPI0022BFD31F|nr:hypothetical protein [Aquidulcibacter sp.]MCE2891350.1 hypothetical protein [Hyphomonadaceae bacterium]MCZ8209069.1 hypothetical protein [Aquidulcibacter sp.]
MLKLKLIALAAVAGMAVAGCSQPKPAEPAADAAATNEVAPAADAATDAAMNVTDAAAAMPEESMNAVDAAAPAAMPPVEEDRANPDRRAPEEPK